MAVIANHVQSAIGTAVNPISGPVSDAILALSPTIYCKASDGYFTSGAIRIGDVPGVGSVTNWLKSSNAGLACGSLGWSATCVFCIDTDTGADQTIASKAASANYEWQLTWIRSSATTGSLRLTCYTANGASSITATSAVAVNVGTAYQVSWAYDGDDCHISVNNESLVTSSGTLTMVSGTADFRIGSYQITDQHFNGRIDSFGISIGDQYCLAQRTQFYSSGAFKQYADITGIKTLTAWWDFGNATIYDQVDADPNNWEATYDWLIDSVGGGTTSTYTLTQATASTEYPYVVKGLAVTALTADTDTGALGYTDSSGNGNHAVQPLHFSRPGFKTVSGRTWFYFDGTVPLSATAYNSRWMPVPLNTADQTTMTGSNKSWSMTALVKSLNVLAPSSSGSPAAPLIAQTVAGICRFGRPPWRLIGTAESSTPGIHAVRYHILPTTAESPYVPYSTAGATRWAIDRQVDSGRINIAFDDYAGRFDTAIHSVTFTFDGSTQTSTLYVDGNVVATAAQTNDNATAAGALGTQAIKYFVMGESLHADNFNRGFPPIEYGGGGKGFYGYMDRVAFWAGTVLTPTQVTAIADDHLGTISHPLSGALAAPTTTTGLTLLHWLDAAYGQRFVQKSSPSSYAIADGDKVGSWRSRKGVATFTASTDAKRPTLKLAIQNSLPVVRSDGNTNSQLLSYSSARSQPYTLFIVGWRQSGSAEGYLWGHDSGAGYFGFSNATTVNLYMGATVSGSATSQTTPSLWKVRVNGASSSIVRDGATVASGNAGSDSLTIMRIFGIQDTGSLYYLPADIAELRVYTGTDAGGEEAAITEELKAKWGTP